MTLVQGRDHIISVSETHFWFVGGKMPPKIREAICDWIEFHGLDPTVIPQSSTLMRVPHKCQIMYSEILRDEDGNRQLGTSGQLLTRVRIEQGEAPPLPFPRVVLDLASRPTNTAPSD